MNWRRSTKRALVFLERLRREIGYDDCMGMSAQIAYYMLLSTFPFLILLISLVSYLPVGSSLESLIFDSLREQMPLEAAEFVVGIVGSVLPTRSQQMTFFGFALSIWGGSMAVGAMITTINRAYNLRPRRHLLTQKFLAINLTLLLSAVFLAAMLIILFGPTVTQNVFEFVGLAGENDTFWTSMRLPIAAFLIAVGLGILYYYAPEAKQRLVAILPGTVTATVLWLLASSAFRLFVRRFGDYNATYGSLAAVVVLMAWYWLTGFAFLLGAEINALMKRMESEEGHRRVRPLQ